MTDWNAIAAAATPKTRGRPKGATSAPPVLPPSRWVSPEGAATYLGISIATLWRGVAIENLTSPSYPTPKAPRFHLDILDADMARLRELPSVGEAGRRAARLTEAREKARQAQREREMGTK
jgi:hypothetical protein